MKTLEVSINTISIFEVIKHKGPIFLRAELKLQMTQNIFMKTALKFSYWRITFKSDKPDELMKKLIQITQISRLFEVVIQKELL